MVTAAKRIEAKDGCGIEYADEIPFDSFCIDYDI